METVVLHKSYSKSYKSFPSKLITQVVPSMVCHSPWLSAILVAQSFSVSAVKCHHPTVALAAQWHVSLTETQALLSELLSLLRLPVPIPPFLDFFYALWKPSECIQRGL